MLGPPWMPWLVMAALCVFVPMVDAFNMVGIMPDIHQKGDKIEVKMVKMSSSHTHMNYAVYSEDLPFCKPTKIIKQKGNLGQILSGERVTNSPYVIKFLDDQPEKVILCTQTVSETQRKTLKERIQEDYRIQWSVDNLPASTDVDKNFSKILGFRLGYENNGKVFVLNHLDITIEYTTQAQGGVEEAAKEAGYIVGIVVRPLSYSSTKGPLELTDTTKSITWSYTVRFKHSGTVWAKRWDQFLSVSTGTLMNHIRSMLSSIMLIVFATLIVGYLIIKVLRKDIYRYNAELGDDESLIEETGWKLVAGDVFRPPRMPMLLASLYGSGVQILTVILFLAVLAVCGLLSPSNRGLFVNSAVAYFVLAAVNAGYSSGNFYRLLQGEMWKRAALGAASLYPVIIFVIVFFSNAFLAYESSSSAVPGSTLFGLFAIWLLISCPLVIVGSFFGFRKQPLEVPVRINQIPRIVPGMRWYLRPGAASVLWPGVLPLLVIYYELHYMLDGIWGEGYFYLVGIMFVLMWLMFIACAEMAVLSVYLSLCEENYHWWWRAFISGGSVAIYVFVYSINYLFHSQVEGLVPVLYYLCVSAIISITLFIAAGVVGLWASLRFVMKMYSSLKID